ncbi:MAG: peptide chain release factor N(5)-glutamine methyltransferase [Gammaproteobacteria bacterium]|jgi:release factor glutamine methyltransferase|nr:peptide chain release factor N(5)-glutamine methyltransferase [Gammaproteobacteria bacterium]
MNIQQALQQASSSLSEVSPTAALDTQVLLSHVLHCNTAHLAAWPEKDLSKEQQTKYLNLIQQRIKGIPVAYLTQQREFWSLNFSVNDSTLIPRPDTETLVEYILSNFNDKENLTLLDLGTGTGAIAISIASERPSWEIVASDLSEDAIILAKQNSETHQTHRIAFLQSDWFSEVSRYDFDIIVSNPPYIAANDPHLRQGDVRFEPERALISGETGMDDIEHLCLHAKDYLKEGGSFIVEHGYNQQHLVAECFTNNGYIDIKQKQDLTGHVRMTTGKTLHTH